MKRTSGRRRAAGEPWEIARSYGASPGTIYH